MLSGTCNSVRDSSLQIQSNLYLNETSFITGLEQQQASERGLLVLVNALQQAGARALKYERVNDLFVKLAHHIK